MITQGKLDSGNQACRPSPYDKHAPSAGLSAGGSRQKTLSVLKQDVDGLGQAVERCIVRKKEDIALGRG